MMSKNAEPLRGEAAWKAEKKRVADRNEEAYARGRDDRAARNAAHARERREAERQDHRDLPKPPRG
jgi:hypothetical protein